MARGNGRERRFDQSRHPCCSPAADAVAERVARSCTLFILRCGLYPGGAVRVGLFAGRPQMRVVQIGTTLKETDSDGGLRRRARRSPRVQAMWRSQRRIPQQRHRSQAWMPPRATTEPANVLTLTLDRWTKAPAPSRPPWRRRRGEATARRVFICAGSTGTSPPAPKG